MAENTQDHISQDSQEQSKLEELALLQEQLAVDLQARFAANLKAFESFMPEVTQAFKNYRPKKTLQFFCTENGVPNLEFPDENHRIFYNCNDPWEWTEKSIESELNSKPLPGTVFADQKDPYGQIHFRYLKEVQQTVKELFHGDAAAPFVPSNIGGIANCVVLGLGLGYPLGVLYSKVEIANLIAIEPDPDIFYASLHAFDWASLLSFIKDNGLGFKLIVGQASETLYELINDFYIRHGVFLSTQGWTYVGYVSDEILACKRELERDFYRIHATLGFFDDHLFATSHALQSMLMKKHFVRRTAKVPAIFTKWPVFIVGNGPSLDHDIQFLRANQDKAIIIACGTALDTLYHAGVKPDFYAATERTPEISETIDAIPDQEFKDSLCLIAGDVIHPKTSSRFKHTCIFGKPDDAFFWFYNGHHTEDQRLKEIDVMNPLVGNLGVASIFAFKFKEAYLFGLDNGRKIDSGEAMHSKYSTVYNAAGVSDKGGNYTVDKNKLLPGNFGGFVESGMLFKLSQRYMEKVIESPIYGKIPGQKIFNCSDGAAVAGTIPMHSEDIDFNSRPALNKTRFMDFVEHEFTFVPDLEKEGIDRLIEKREFNLIIDRLEKLLIERPATRTALVKRLMTVSETIYAVSQDRYLAGLSWFLRGTTQCMLIHVLFMLYHVEDEQIGVQKAWDLLTPYKRFLEDARRLYQFLPDYVLGEHYHFCDDKIGWDHEGSTAPEAPAYPKLYKKEFDDPLKKFVKRYE